MKPGTCSECGAVGMVESHAFSSFDLGAFSDGRMWLCSACHRAERAHPEERRPVPDDVPARPLRMRTWDVERPEVTWEGDEESRPVSFQSGDLIRLEGDGTISSSGAGSRRPIGMVTSVRPDGTAVVELHPLASGGPWSNLPTTIIPSPDGLRQMADELREMQAGRVLPPLATRWPRRITGIEDP